MAGRLVPALVALLAGLAQAAAIAAPWDGEPRGWLQLLSAAALAWLLLARPLSLRRAAGLAWLFATAWLTGTFWWLFISMHFYGGLPAPLAALAVLLLAGFLASYYAAAAAAVAWLAPRGPVRAALALAGAWTLAELARGTWFTGFPWGAGGYAHVDGFLAGLAPLVGVYGIGCVAWLLASLAATTLRARSVRAAAMLLVAGAAAASASLAPATSTSAAAGPERLLGVTLLQGNIPQDEKFQGGTGIPLALHWYGLQLRDAAGPLVVAPETAIPLLPHQLPSGYFEAVQGRFADGRRAALVGLPLGNFEQGYTNSVYGLKAGSPVYRYDKHHLVPFGEFIPPMFKWFTQMMNIPLGDFNRGDVGQPSFEWRSQRLAPNVCYEDLFGEELAARFRDPARAPTIFVNVSNIAWFGDSVAIDQHLHISRMRALEFERPMLRATNTGATVAIDHRGQVTHSLPRLTRGVLQAQVEGRTGLTPFAAWAARWGLWPLVAVAAALLALSASARDARAGRR